MEESVGEGDAVGITAGYPVTRVEDGLEDVGGVTGMASERRARRCALLSTY